MKIRNVLFDLDGTLLPMDQDAFTKGYFAILAKKLVAHGYNPDKLVKDIWSGVTAMVKNDGKMNNDEAFWQDFERTNGKKSIEDRPLFDEFYANEFKQAKVFCGYTPVANQAIQQIKNCGCRVILATNPIFPAIATETRIDWAGLNASDFDLYTTYENCNYCKPNPKYYQDICERLNLNPQECLMIGNDALEDMVAQTIGMKVFLLTDCLVNKKDLDINQYPHGDFKKMMEFVKENI